MSIRCQHSEEQRSFRSECCSDLFWLCPTCCHLYWCVVEERNKWLWSQLEESMALNQFLCPCCWRAVAACSILSWSFTDCQRAGGNKHIPRRSCCKADCQNCTERGGGEISQSMQGWWHLFTTIDCIHKNKIKKKTKVAFSAFSAKQCIQVQDRYLELTTRSSVYTSKAVQMSALVNCGLILPCFLIKSP